MKKIIIAFLLLIFTMGIASAVNYGDFEIPNGYSQLTAAENTFVDNDNQSLVIYEFNSANQELFFTNRTGFIVSNFRDNIYNFHNFDEDSTGNVEIVDVNGTKYIVVLVIPVSSIRNCFTNTYKELVGFNQLNNITPVQV